MCDGHGTFSPALCLRPVLAQDSRVTDRTFESELYTKEPQEMSYDNGLSEAYMPERTFSSPYSYCVWGFFLLIKRWHEQIG